MGLIGVMEGNICLYQEMTDCYYYSFRNNCMMMFHSNIMSKLKNKHMVLLHTMLMHTP